MISRYARSCIVFNFLCVCIAEYDAESSESLNRARAMAKPWYTQSIEVGGVNLHVSPVSVFIIIMSVLYIFSAWTGKQSQVVASHILLKDPSDATRKKLEDWKKKIGANAALFAKYAAENSACPSKRQGGNLGRFKKYDMAPPFDRVCFDPATPIRTTVGPVQTQFGWHLIFIHDRELHP